MGPQESDIEVLSDLPENVLNSVLGELRIEDIHASRQLAKALLQPASSAVKTLHSNDGKLPAVAWAKFPRADGLRIKLPFSKHPISHEVVHLIVQTLLQAPNRLKRLIINRFQCEEVDTTKIIDALLATNFADPADATTTVTRPMALEQLHLDTPIKFSDAKAITEVLAASIQDLQLTIGTDSDSTTAPDSIPQWCPCKLASSALRKLHLELESPIDLDVAPLGSCTTLTELWINGQRAEDRAAVRNTARLGSLLQLKQLALLDCAVIYEGVVTPEQEQEHWQDVLYGMDQMQQLVLPFLRCGASLWKQIAQKMRSIKRISFASLRVGGPEASPVQELELCDSLLLEGQWGEQPEGCLASVMPELEFLLVTAAADVSTWAPGITGHQQLQHLTVEKNMFGNDGSDDGDDDGDDDGWNQLCFSTCPKMHTLELQYVNGCNMDALMQQLAGCPELHSLEILQAAEDGQRITMEGLAALAQGPAGQRLRHLYLATPYSFSLDDVVPLVSEPSRIMSASLTVEPDMPWRDDVLRARQQEDVEGLVRQWVRCLRSS